MLICVFSAGSTFAQLTYEKRFESNLPRKLRTHKVLPLGNNGVLMITHVVNSSWKQVNRYWKYTLLDSTLNLLQENRFSLNGNQYFDNYVVSGNQTLLLFKGRKRDFSIMIFKGNNEPTYISGNLPFKASIYQTVVMGEVAYLFLRAYCKTHIWKVNLQTGDQSPISFHIGSAGNSILGVQVFDSLARIHCYLSVSLGKDLNNTYILKIQKDKQKADLILLTETTTPTLCAISGIHMGGEKFRYVGSYSLEGIYSSEGLYLCELEKDEVLFYHFYAFSEMEGILAHLTPEQRDRLDRQRERAKKPYRLSYKLAAHEAKKLKNGIMYLGEVFYDTYITEENTLYTTCPDGTEITEVETEEVFDGYQYTHGIVAIFKEDGTLAWDQSFDMKLADKPATTKRFVKIAPIDEAFVQLKFIQKDRIVTKIINYESYLMKDEISHKIMVNENPGEMTLRSFRISPWYKNYFLVYGWGNLKGIYPQTAGEKRKVHFLGKIQ